MQRADRFLHIDRPNRGVFLAPDRLNGIDEAIWGCEVFYPARSSASQGVGNRWHALGKPGRDWGSDGILAWRRTGHDLHCWGEEQGKGRLARPRSTRVRVDNADGVVP